MIFSSYFSQMFVNVIITMLILSTAVQSVPLKDQNKKYLKGFRKKYRLTQKVAAFVLFQTNN